MTSQELSEQKLNPATLTIRMPAHVQHLADLDTLRIDVGMAWSLSRGVLRTVTIWEPDYTSRKKDPWTLLVENLSFEGGEESVEALLRRLADLIENAKVSAASSSVVAEQVQP